MILEGIQWLFLDMGSTLVDETASYREWFRRASAAVGGQVSPEGIAQEYERGMARYRATVIGQLKPYGYRENTTAHLYPSELDIAYPQAKPLLETLSKQYSIGIIANQSLGAAERLETYGLLRFIDFVLGSAEAGVSKPDPRIFQLALEKAGCKPHQAVMIGDRPDNDIYPAKRLGMKTIRIRQGSAACQLPKSKAYEADVTIHSLDELYGVLL